MPKIFAHTSKGHTVNQIRDNIEDFLEKHEGYKIYFIRDMKLNQHEMNFIVSFEYDNWLKDQQKNNIKNNWQKRLLVPEF